MRLVSLYGYVCRTYPGSCSALRFILSGKEDYWNSLVTQLPQYPCVIGPGPAHLDPGAKIDLAAEHALHVLARRRAHPLQSRAPGAHHHRLLALALDQDRRFYAPQPALLLEAFDHHVAPIRQLLPHLHEQLLAQQLRGEKAFVAVGELVRRIGRGRFGQGRTQRLQELRDVLAGMRADRNHGLKIPQLGEALEKRDQLGPVLHEVDLVHHGYDLLSGRDALCHGTVLRPEAQRLDHEQRDIGVARRFGRAPVERPVQGAAPTALLPRRVDKHVLAVLAGQDSGHEVARGLGLRRYDRQLLTHQAVEQARLAGVRPSGDAYGAAAMRVHAFSSFSSIARAACCSARWREVPLPVALSPASGSAHSTSKDWRCDAPRTDSTR